MKLGIILQSNKAEHIWNTFRLSNASLRSGHSVKIFLLNEGAELDTVSDTEDFDITSKISEFKKSRGEIFACGTCLKFRNKGGSKICPVSTMVDLVKMIEESEKV